MRIFIILCFLVSSLWASGQTKNELALLTKNNNPHKHKTSWNIAKNNNTSLEIVLSSVFLAYKFFISSQDSQSCSFSPSCSVYAVETIKKQGFILGILDTFDRLSRCNGMSPEKYSIDYKHSLLIDPVRNSHYHEL